MFMYIITILFLSNLIRKSKDIKNPLENNKNKVCLLEVNFNYHNIFTFLLILSLQF